MSTIQEFRCHRQCIKAGTRILISNGHRFIRHVISHHVTTRHGRNLSSHSQYIHFIDRLLYRFVKILLHFKIKKLY